MYRTLELFDLEHTLARELLEGCEYPWLALPKIGETILTLGPDLGETYKELLPQVWVHETAIVAPTASITGPCIIGPGTEVRHCAFIRGNVLVGENCVVGNSVELKNVIIFDRVEVPHFNYAGDSILGYCSHMGAGSVTSNIKSDRTDVVMKDGDTQIPTGMLKIGAMLGDFVEVGCNSVLNPGAVVGRRTVIYPLSSVRGTVPADSILKTGGVIVPKEQRNG